MLSDCKSLAMTFLLTSIISRCWSMSNVLSSGTNILSHADVNQFPWPSWRLLIVNRGTIFLETMTSLLYGPVVLSLANAVIGNTAAPLMLHSTYKMSLDPDKWRTRYPVQVSSLLIYSYVLKKCTTNRMCPNGNLRSL